MVQTLPAATGLRSTAAALGRNFLGDSPRWYKLTIVAFLVANPFVLLLAGPFVAGWLLVLEFIVTLAMALRCYPLQPGGLLAIEGLALGMTTPGSVYDETRANLSVLLLLVFMVAGIYFLRDLLMVAFTKLVVRVRSKLLLSLTFTGAAAVLSAFLDALTVAAVVIAVATGFYTLYHRFASGLRRDEDHDHEDDDGVQDPFRADLDGFRAFLRSLLMHAMVGTALGGLATLVGEPQNLLIGETVGWGFGEFLVRMAPVSIPVLLAGLLMTALLERTGRFGYGAELPASVRRVLEEEDERSTRHRTSRTRAKLAVQIVTALLLVAGLALHVAEVGLIGLGVIVLATAFTGVTGEHALGHAFKEALPFTALLVTFFAIVAVIHDQHLFTPVIGAVLALDGGQQVAALFAASGVLSAISDNVFVATVYIGEVAKAFDAGSISRLQFEHLAIAVNAGTNVPSVATPNGQAAFLFLLTSGIAPLVRLGYVRMLWMALPYAVVMTVVGFLAATLLL
ncbi:sodium/proton antiporter NhaB [Amnibacterium kyonggiense]|uniref:Sodium/proton antiporter (NhaB family) n=1 Tax=Amnibacterium kyonggiense TaxID=595671 RepID=A0A4R7FSA8_9MICO|nr:sodium/proton antiporter NhaB [Amnibacterium kyonggiense]TDS80742.1 sodium/proton antiporter (NhaB family) [Amnibacterium kyonggiense]